MGRKGPSAGSVASVAVPPTLPVFAVPTASGPVRGTFSVPPSKSLHQRALAIAVLAEGSSQIEAEGEPAGDTGVLARALFAMGGRPVSPIGTIEGAFASGALGTSKESIRLGLERNGTGLRISTALATLRPEGARTLVTGDRRLLARPHGPLLAALRRLGGHVRRRHSGSIRIVAGGIRGGEVSIRADTSSQFATALMLVAPRVGGLSLRLVNAPVSAPYVALTAGVLRAFGVPTGVKGERIRVEGVAPRATRYRVEPDASSAAVWWAAAALTGGDVVVNGLAATTAQADARLLGILGEMGATVSTTLAGEARVVGPGGRLRAPGDVDLRDSPDLAHLVAALAASAEGTTRVVNAPHLRAKESDRVASAVAAVRAVGGDAEAREDGFVVRGRPLVGGAVPVRRDHRVALAFGVLGLAVPGVSLLGAEAATKSYPGFLSELARAAGAAG